MFNWLIEHTLLLLPTWFWFIVSGAGAVLYFCSGFILAIPFAQARLAGISIKYIGLGLLLGGVYLTGGAGVTSLWQQQVKEANAQIEAAEAKSKDANNKLAQVRQEKAKVRTEYITTVKERIVKDTQIIDAECKVAPEAIKDLNEAAKNPLKKDVIK